LTGDYLGNNRGIENPASTFNAIHDSTQQFHGFAYMSGGLRLSKIAENPPKEMGLSSSVGHTR
jgi:hypothetical protein